MLISQNGFNSSCSFIRFVSLRRLNWFVSLREVGLFLCRGSVGSFRCGGSFCCGGSVRFAAEVELVCFAAGGWFRFAAGGWFRFAVEVCSATRKSSSAMQQL